MPRQLVVAILISLAAGCTGKVDVSSQGTTTATRDNAAGDSEPQSPSAWLLEKKSSGIDGDQLTASRTFRFDEQQTQFEVVIACNTTTSHADMAIHSFVGDMNNPSPRSALISQAEGQAVNQSSPLLEREPMGRIKLNDGKVEDLYSYFDIDQSYGNYANYLWYNPRLQNLLVDEPSYRGGEERSDPSFFNSAKVIQTLLPLTAEVSNGAGQFELTIDSSPEVASVLRTCGSDKPLLTAAYTSPSSDEVKSLKAQLVQRAREECSEYGRHVSSDLDQIAAKLGFSWECSTAAPDHPQGAADDDAAAASGLN